MSWGPAVGGSVVAEAIGSMHRVGATVGGLRGGSWAAVLTEALDLSVVGSISLSGRAEGISLYLVLPAGSDMVTIHGGKNMIND